MQLPTRAPAPPTVGKYRHGLKVVPVLTLPSPDPPRSPSPPPPMHLYLKEQFIKERHQQSPGFTDRDLARKNSIEYLNFGRSATITIKEQPICCKTHDFFHQHLNWDARNWIPTICPRYSHHHHQNMVEKRKRNPRKLAPLKRKPPTIPVNPFKSKDKRNLERPWLKSPKSNAEHKPSVRLILPHEDENCLPNPWMIDNSTMTEDSISDIFSIATSIPTGPPSLSDVIQKPIQVKKKRSVTLVDKACDVMTPALVSSPPESHHTIETESRGTEEHLRDISSADIQSIRQLSEEIKEKTVDNVIQINGEETEAVTDAAKNESEAEPIKTEKNNAITPNEDQNEHDSSENNYPANLPPDMQNENEVLALHCTTHKETDSTPDSSLALHSDLIEDDSEALDLVPSLLKCQSPTTSSVERSKRRPLPPPPKLIPEVLNDTEDDFQFLPKSKVFKTKEVVVVPAPSFSSDRPESSISSTSNRTTSALTPLSHRSSSRRKAIRDRTIAEEMQRAELAEQRRRKAKEKFEKIKQNRKIPKEKMESRNVTPEDDGFMDRLSIHNLNKLKSYRRTFDSFDIDEDGFLDAEEVYLAIQKLLPSDSFKDSHISHILRLLELVNYNIVSEKIDFKLFSVIASLAQKIAGLDDFMRGLIDRFDIQSLDSKMWRARQFFDYFVDDMEKQTISMENLWLELKAGGIGPKHETQIKESLKHLPHLDLLDFMTYLPLFTLTHSHVTSYPLNDERVQ